MRAPCEMESGRAYRSSSLDLTARSAAASCVRRMRHILDPQESWAQPMRRFMDVEEFRRLGHELIDWIADYREKAYRGDFPVMRNVAPGTVKRALPAAPPTEPEPFDAVLTDLNNVILPACTQWVDPRFFGYFPSNSSLAAVLGDYVSTGLAQLGLNWQASPALNELEG